ncbi:MAG: hypothetical protein ACJ79K_02205 [Gemmatimonadaceae bacterium]
MEVEVPLVVPLGAVLSVPARDALPMVDDMAAVSPTAAVSDVCFEGRQAAAASTAAVIASEARRFMGYPA